MKGEQQLPGEFALPTGWSDSLDFIRLLSLGFPGSLGALSPEQLGNARNTHGGGDEAVGEGVQPASKSVPNSKLGNWTRSNGSCDSQPTFGAAPGWTDSWPLDSQAANVKQTGQQALTQDSC